ncbi:hypothetical protein V6N13_079964 [Hibiscus sabdariffa]
MRLNERASCGGVIRNHLDEWIRGFSKFIGYCSALKVELWGIYSEIYVAWNMGLRNIIVESDCAEDIKLIHQDDRLGGSLIIVHHIQEFLKKN